MSSVNESGATQPVQKIGGKEVMVFSVDRVRKNRKPCVTIGRFRDGRIAIHMRQYETRSSGELAITRDGVSWTVEEFDCIVERLREVLPSLKVPAT